MNRVLVRSKWRVNWFRNDRAKAYGRCRHTYGRKMSEWFCIVVLCESIGRWHSNCYSSELIRHDHFNVLWLWLFVCERVAIWLTKRESKPVYGFPKTIHKTIHQNQFCGNSSEIDLTMSVCSVVIEMWWSHFDCMPIQNWDPSKIWNDDIV